MMCPAAPLDSVYINKKAINYLWEEDETEFYKADELATKLSVTLMKHLPSPSSPESKFIDDWSLEGDGTATTSASLTGDVHSGVIVGDVHSGGVGGPCCTVCRSGVADEAFAVADSVCGEPSELVFGRFGGCCWWSVSRRCRCWSAFTS